MDVDLATWRVSSTIPSSLTRRLNHGPHLDREDPDFRDRIDAIDRINFIRYFRHCKNAKRGALVR